MTNLHTPPRLDELPPPSQAPLAAPAPPRSVPPPPPQPTPLAPPGTSTALVVTSIGVIAVALAAAAGGALWLPRDGDADRGAAVVRGLIGAGVAGMVAGLVFAYLHGGGHLRRFGAAASSLTLAAGIVLIALGALLGASTAPLRDDDARPQPDQAANETPVSEDAEAALVDADGNGLPDRDADGNLVIAFDPDGDGTFQGRLVPCRDREEYDDVDPWSAEVRLDFDCDGDVDATVPMNLRMIGDGQLTGPMSEEGLWSPGDEVDGIGGDANSEDPDPASPGPVPDADENDSDNDEDGGGAIGKVLLTLLAIATLAVLGYVLAKVLRRRERGRSSAVDNDSDVEPADETVDAGAVDAAIEESIEALLGHPDPRLAIRAAYAVLLNALAEAGFARRSFEAPEEHLSRCLTGLDVRSEPMQTLLRLFAVARFSTHDVSEDDRTEAVAALRASQRELRERAGAEAVGARQ